MKVLVPRFFYVYKTFKHVSVWIMDVVSNVSHSAGRMRFCYVELKTYTPDPLVGMGRMMDWEGGSD